MSTQHSTVETIREDLRQVLADLAVLATRADDGHEHLPTPCSEFDVAALRSHTVGWLENFAAGLAAPDGVCPRADVTDVQVPRGEAPERIASAAAVLDEAVRAGAAQRPLVISAQGGMPGEMALSMIRGEYLLHGWDLARATGQPWAPDERACADALTFFTQIVLPEYRGPGGMFGAEVPVPADASALDQLVGFSGRDPAWRP